MAQSKNTKRFLVGASATIVASAIVPVVASASTETLTQGVVEVETYQNILDTVLAVHGLTDSTGYVLKAKEEGGTFAEVSDLSAVVPDKNLFLQVVKGTEIVQSVSFEYTEATLEEPDAVKELVFHTKDTNGEDGNPLQVGLETKGISDLKASGNEAFKVLENHKGAVDTTVLQFDKAFEVREGTNPAVKSIKITLQGVAGVLGDDGKDGTKRTAYVLPYKPTTLNTEIVTVTEAVDGTNTTGFVFVTRVVDAGETNDQKKEFESFMKTLQPHIKTGTTITQATDAFVNSYTSTYSAGVDEFNKVLVGSAHDKELLKAPVAMDEVTKAYAGKYVSEGVRADHDKATQELQVLVTAYNAVVNDMSLVQEAYGKVTADSTLGDIKGVVTKELVSNATNKLEQFNTALHAQFPTDNAYKVEPSLFGAQAVFAVSNALTLHDELTALDKDSSAYTAKLGELKFAMEEAGFDANVKKALEEALKANTGEEVEQTPDSKKFSESVIDAFTATDEKEVAKKVAEVLGVTETELQLSTLVYSNTFKTMTLTLVKEALNSQAGATVTDLKADVTAGLKVAEKLVLLDSATASTYKTVLGEATKLATDAGIDTSTVKEVLKAYTIFENALNDSAGTFNEKAPTLADLRAGKLIADAGYDFAAYKTLLENQKGSMGGANTLLADTLSVLEGVNKLLAKDLSKTDRDKTVTAVYRILADENVLNTVAIVYSGILEELKAEFALADKEEEGTLTEEQKFVKALTDALNSKDQGVFSAKTIADLLGVDVTALPSYSAIYTSDFQSLTSSILTEALGSKTDATLPELKTKVLAGLELTKQVATLFVESSDTYGKVLEDAQKYARENGIDTKEVKSLLEVFSVFAGALNDEKGTFDDESPTLEDLKKGLLIAGADYDFKEFKKLLEAQKDKLGVLYGDLEGTLAMLESISNLLDKDLKEKDRDALVKTLDKVFADDADVILLSSVLDVYEGIFEELKSEFGLDGGQKPPTTVEAGTINVKELRSTSYVYTDYKEGVVLKYALETKYETGQTATLSLGNKTYQGVYDEKTNEWVFAITGLSMGLYNGTVTLQDNNNKKLESVTYKHQMTAVGVAEKMNAILKQFKDASKNSTLSEKEIGIVHNYYTAAYDLINDKKDFDTMAKVFEDYTALNNNGEAHKQLLELIKTDVLKVFIGASETPSAQTLAKVLNLKDLKLDDKDVQKLVEELMKNNSKATTEELYKKVTNVVKAYSALTIYTKNPSTANKELVEKAFKDVDETAGSFKSLKDAVLQVMSELSKKDLKLADIENLKLSDLGTDNLSEAVKLTHKVYVNILKLEDKPANYKEKSWEDAVKEIDKFLKEADKTSDLYKNLNERYNKVKEANGESTTTVTVKDKTTTVTHTGKYDKEIVFSLDKDDVNTILKDGHTALVLQSKDGVEITLNVASLGLQKLKEDLGDYSLKLKIEKTNGTKGFKLGMTATSDADEKKTKDITNLGKMTKVVIDTKHLDMGKALSKNRLFRVVTDASGNKTYVPVLGKTVRDSAGNVVGYEIYTQYLGEFVIMEQDTKITDTERFYNAEGMKDFVDRGILKMDADDKFNPNGGLSVGDVSDALTVAFGSVSTDKTKITEIIGSDIPTFIQNRLGLSVSTSSEITREQTASLVMGMFEKQDKTISDSLKATSPTGYQDAVTIETKAMSDVAKMQEAKIMIGKDTTTFGAKEKLTKSQFAKVLRKALIKLKLIDDTIEY